MTALLPAGDEWKEGTEEDLSLIQNCYCPNCGGSKAITHLLPTKVPLFREIIVMTLMCDECSYRNSEVSFGGAIQEKGQRLTWTVRDKNDLNRQVIKSDSCTLLLPEIELEIPAQTQRGTISTLEGVLRRAAENLEALQPERLRLGDVDNFHRCRRVIGKLREFAGGNDGEADDEEEEKSIEIFPFTVILDDPAGNSFVENPRAPQPDPNLRSEFYERTPTQDMSLGLQPSQQALQDGAIEDTNPQHKNVVNAAPSHQAVVVDSTVSASSSNSVGSTTTNLAKQEVLKFPTTCPHCHRPSETSMCATDIPHFKEVIIMSMLCENCGYKSNEIKGGGAIPKFGTRITLLVQSADDLAREVLKSDTAGISIPELDLELAEGGLDGLYTTVEGLLQKMRDRLQAANPFGSGDSATKQHTTNDGGEFSSPSPQHQRYRAFLDKLQHMAEGGILPFTLVITDPLSNSFVGPIPQDAVALSLQAEREGNHRCYDLYVDYGMKLEEYERTHEQNEILGLNDMRVENYQSPPGKGEGGGVAACEYYGTDQALELPDRLQRLDVRGPDHPHEVGKAPVEGDTTVMGPNSLNFAVPSMGQRGTKVTASGSFGFDKDAKAFPSDSASVPSSEASSEKSLSKLLHDYEFQDPAFVMNSEYDGSRDGFVFKDGAQGVGYYTNKPMVDLWNER
jgi:zinc finger protein